MSIISHAGQVRAHRAPFSRLKTVLMAGALMGAGLGIALPASASSIFTGNLVVSALTYTGSASTVTVGQNLPTVDKKGVAIKATANGAFGNVFLNDVPDANFGVTSPYSLQFFNSNGQSATLTSTYNISSSSFTGSFASKSEGAINVSADGTAITLMG